MKSCPAASGSETEPLVPIFRTQLPGLADGMPSHPARQAKHLGSDRARDVRQPRQEP